MLTQDQRATVRAALRFWRDEMIPTDQKTRCYYFDDLNSPQFTAREIEKLIAHFQLADNA